MKRILTIVTLFCSLFSQGQFQDVTVQVGPFFWNTRPGIIYLPPSYSDSPNKRYPVQIFLHGMGEGSSSRNNNLLTSTGQPYLIKNGQKPEATVNGIKYEYIVLCPQFAYGETAGIYGRYDNYSSILNWLFANYRVDSSLVVITGLSLGAEGAIGWAVNQPNRVAAVIPVAPTGYLNQPPDKDSVKRLYNKHVGLWTIAGSNDGLPTDAFNKSLTLVNDYNTYSPDTPGIRTVINGANHSGSTWNVFYDTAFRDHLNNATEMNVYEWPVQFKKTFSTVGTGGGGGGGGSTPSGDTLSGLKIPITGAYIYQDNSQQDRADKLVDGDTTSNYSPARPIIYKTHDIVFDLSEWNARVTGVKMWIAASDTGTVKVIVVKYSNDAETQIGTFTGGNNQKFIYPNSDTSRVRKVILRTTSSNYQFGSEVQIWGSFTNPPNPSPKGRTPLGYLFGAVAHDYDLMNDAKLNKLKSLDISTLRVWENGYDITDASWNWKFKSGISGGRYTTDSALTILKAWKPSIYTWKVANEQYTPQKNSWNVIDDFPNRYIKGKVNSYTNHGSWGEIMLNVLQVGGADGNLYGRWYVYKNGVQINVTETPEYLAADLPGQNRHFNVGGGLSVSTGDTLYFYKSQLGGNPIDYADNSLSRRSTDSAHLKNGQAMFVFASRGGSNASVPDYPVQAGERMLKGMGYYDAVEPSNEPNHWWSNFDNFWNGKTIFYHMNMSYDGNKKAFANTGAKQADSTIDVIMSGLATDKPDQIYAMIDEARIHRGYLPDGTINVPFNTINVHIYPSAGGQYGFGNNGALPWEIGARPQIKTLVNLLERKAPHCKLIVTEFGFDLHPNSTLHAGMFGSYDREAVAAFWMISAMVTMNVDKIDRATYYPLFQDWPESQSSNDATQFKTMRLLRQPVDANADSIVRSRQGDYMAQFAEFKDYEFYDSLTTGQDWLHAYRFRKPNTDSVFYYLRAVEQVSILNDTTHFTERTGTINISIPAGNYKIRQFKDDGSDRMSTTTGTSTGTVTFNYAAKPIIIQTVLPGDSIKKKIQIPFGSTIRRRYY